jgi:hypothetical protein
VKSGRSCTDSFGTLFEVTIEDRVNDAFMFNVHKSRRTNRGADRDYRSLGKVRKDTLLGILTHSTKRLSKTIPLNGIHVMGLNRIPLINRIQGIILRIPGTM